MALIIFPRHPKSGRVDTLTYLRVDETTRHLLDTTYVVGAVTETEGAPRPFLGQLVPRLTFLACTFL
jgi:hypothetical protein